MNRVPCSSFVSSAWHCDERIFSYRELICSQLDDCYCRTSRHWALYLATLSPARPSRADYNDTMWAEIIYESARAWFRESLNYRGPRLVLKYSELGIKKTFHELTFCVSRLNIMPASQWRRVNLHRWVSINEKWLYIATAPGRGI